MPLEPNALAKIEDLKAQIAKLQEDAVKELKQKRDALASELEAVDVQLSELTGKATSGKSEQKTTRPRRSPISDEDLKGRVLDIMAKQGKGGLNAKQIGGYIDQAPVRISAFIKKNPKVLKRQGTGPTTKFFLP